MCTAASYKTKDFYFGRTLDYEFSYGEEIVITPRNFAFDFLHEKTIKNHYAIIGMAHVINEYPLYYDAMNEKGLAVAGLNFVGNAVYSSSVEQEKYNIAQYEFINWILSQCENVKKAQQLLENTNVLDTPFSSKLPAASLHWMISDKDNSITVEIVKDGMKIYKNNVGVLTNNPPFNMQLENLKKYENLSSKSSISDSEKIDRTTFSRGMGAVGLPGDLSSMSRFVRAAFVRKNSISQDDELSSVSQFFHILGSVNQQRGCCDMGDNKYEITIYTSCLNTSKGIYYYTTYDNNRINCVDMFKEELQSNTLIKFPLLVKQDIFTQN